MDIQVGDRVIYKSLNEPNYQKREIIVTDENEIIKILKHIKDTHIEILKIERPLYEEKYKEGITTHHVTIETDKLKELILENNNYYRNLSLKTKITLVKQYAKFDNDTDLLEFLEFMEE